MRLSLDTGYLTIQIFMNKEQLRPAQVEDFFSKRWYRVRFMYSAAEPCCRTPDLLRSHSVTPAPAWCLPAVEVPRCTVLPCRISSEAVSLAVIRHGQRQEQSQRCPHTERLPPPAVRSSSMAFPFACCQLIKCLMSLLSVQHKHLPFSIYGRVCSLK